MLLTLKETAQYLGKSQRQIRYLVKSGQIKARKQEGRWVFDDVELPLSESQRRARERKAAELAAVVEDSLRDQTRPPGKRSYSVVDLSAFRHGLAATRAAGERFGDHGGAVVALRQSLVALAQGCHRFHQRDKADAFGAARERAAEAVALLHVDGTEAAITIANAVEQSYLGALVGLLRREKKRGRP